MSDNNSSLMNITVQQYLAKQAVEAPETIYAKIKQAEDWLEELKEIARVNLFKKMPDNQKTLDIETLENTIHVTRNRGKFKPEVVHAILTKLNIDTSNITFEKPKAYGTKPEAFDILQAYLEQGVLTQVQFDSMFEKGNFTVKLQPKSAMTVALNSIGNGE